MKGERYLEQRGATWWPSVLQRLPSCSPGAVVTGWAGGQRRRQGRGQGRRGRRRGSLTPGAMQLGLPPPVTLGPCSEDTAFFPWTKWGESGVGTSRKRKGRGHLGPQGSSLSPGLGLNKIKEGAWKKRGSQARLKGKTLPRLGPGSAHWYARFPGVPQNLFRAMQSQK